MPTSGTTQRFKVIRAPSLERHARQLSSDSYPTNDRRTRKDAVSCKGRRQPEVPATDATLKASLSKPADDIGAGFNTGTQCE